MDIGLDDRGIHTQATAPNDALLAGNGHHPLMQLLDNLGAKRDGEPAERLRIGDLAASHPRELPIHQVRAHLALEHGVAPVAHVLEQEQPQDDLGGRSQPSARAAVRCAPREGFVDDLHQLPIGEQSIDLTHPVLPQRADFLLDQALGEGQLRGTRGLDHLKTSRAAWRARCLSRSSEFNNCLRFSAEISAPIC
jgi:hypothetical protein